MEELLVDTLFAIFRAIVRTHFFVRHWVREVVRAVRNMVPLEISERLMVGSNKGYVNPVKELIKDTIRNIIDDPVSAKAHSEREKNFTQFKKLTLRVQNSESDSSNSNSTNSSDSTSEEDKEIFSS